MLIAIIVAAILSATLYRAGGMSKDPGTNPTWIPVWMRHSIVRRLGCPIVALALMVAFFAQVPWWIHAISFGCMFGFMTTYWDDIFGYDNFFAHGFGIAIAYLPYAMITGCWYGFIMRVIILSAFMGLWCLAFENDVMEEMGRGASIQATLLAMLWLI